MGEVHPWVLGVAWAWTDHQRELDVELHPKKTSKELSQMTRRRGKRRKRWRERRGKKKREKMKVRVDL